MKNIFAKNYFLIVLILFCLPSFFLNVKDSHDWGDDFAQYIIQARNILEHRPQTDNGLVFDEQSGDYALRAYPVGFPLLLAGVMSVKGNSILAFSYLISTVLFLLCVTMFLYFRKYFSQLTAFFLVMIFLYNPVTISFKLEALSDLPFSLWILIATILFTSRKKSYAHFFLIGIVAGIALSTRGIGIAFILAVVLFFVKELFVALRTKQNKLFKEHLLKSVIVTATAFLFYFLLNSILFPISSKGFFDFYSHAFNQENIKQAVLQNLQYYIEVFKGFFEPTTGQWQFISKIAKSLAFTFLILGMLSKWIRRIDFEDMLVIVYLIILFVYPYTAGGFRFLFPIFPFLLKYIVEGMKCIHLPAKVSLKTRIVLPGTFMLLLYVPSLLDTIKFTSSTLSGPQENSAKEVFSYIKNNLPAESVIVFAKPRVLSLYTDKRAAYYIRNQAEDEMKEMFQRMGANYFLVGLNDDELNDMQLKKFLEKFKEQMKPKWSNEKYILYSSAVQ